MPDDMTHLSPLDLRGCKYATSGRSNNPVLLDDRFVYKLFSERKGAEYEREVRESIALQGQGVPVLFNASLNLRKVQLPEGGGGKNYVLMMYRAEGPTFMLAKPGHIASFCNIINEYRNDRTQLFNLRRWFDAASNAGIKDAQFIYDRNTNTPHFIDVHLGGVKGGGDCREICNHIDGLLRLLYLHEPAQPLNRGRSR